MVGKVVEVVAVGGAVVLALTGHAGLAVLVGLFVETLVEARRVADGF